MFKIIDLNEVSTNQIESSNSLFSNDALFYLHNDNCDNTWLCSNGGVFVRHSSQKNFKLVPFPPAKQKNGSTYIFQMADSTLLVSSFRSGLFEIKKGGKGIFA